MARDSGQSGFTLVEMLVAVAVLGLIAVLLSGSVRFGAHALGAQDRRVALAESTAAAESALRDMIINAQPLPLVGLGKRGAAFYAVGDSSSLDFVGPLPEAVSRGGYYDIGLALDDARSLVIRWRRHAHDLATASAETMSETTVVRNVAGIELSYFALATKESAAGWRANWGQPNALPALVRLRLRFSPGDPRLWPELVVAPALGPATN